MKKLKVYSALLGLVAFTMGAYGQLITNTASYTVNLAIPDNDGTGLSDTRTFATVIPSIFDVNVTLNISGDFNGDLYAYVTHGSGFSVLLNRVGRTAGGAFGYADGGFNITFDDAAANGDIHNYRLTLNASHAVPIGGALTGTWAPDGRNVDPAVVTEADASTALLSSFDGQDPNGEWTLFIADLSPGGTSFLVDWGLEVVGVPEPGSWALMIMGGFALLFVTRRMRR